MTHFGDGGERIAFVEKAAGRWSRAGVFVRGSAFVHDLFQPSQAPIGPWLQDDGTLGLPPRRRGRALAAALGATTAMVGFSQLDPEHVARDATRRRRPHDERLHRHRARHDRRVTFDDYWAARGKNLRANMKKQRNKLEAEGVDAALRLPRATRRTSRPRSSTYGRLESAGWKARGGTAVSADNAQGRFYREVFERFAARGMARIYRCFYGDQLAAMDLCIEHHGAMVILKTAFDETIRGTSPAFLMRHDYLPAIFASGDWRASSSTAA